MSETHEKKFRGWWVPRGIIELWEQQEITNTELLLVSVIDSLVDEDKRVGCYASNAYLAERLQVKPRWLMTMIARLIEMGILIKKEDKEGNRHLFTAFSHVKKPRAEGVHDNAPSARQCTGGVQKNAPSFAGKQLPSSLNKQEDTPTPTRSARGGAKLRGGLLGEEIPKTFAEIAAKKLEDALRHHRLFVNTSNTKNWHKDIAKLLDEGVTKDEVKATLLWYIENITEPFTPHAYSAASFVLKYGQIKAASRRSVKKDGPLFMAEKLVPTAEEKAIFDDLRQSNWPKGSVEQLQQAICLTYRRHTKWVKSHYRYVKELNKLPDTDGEGWPTEASRLKGLIPMLNELYRGSVGFTTVWFSTMQKRLASWEEWSGDLTPFIWHQEHKEFHKMGLTVTTSGGWSASLWDKYLKSINEN